MAKMTVKQIEDRVQAIRAERLDDERAHSMEDDLYTDVLKAITTGSHVESAARLAGAALKTKRIGFRRWAG